MYCALLCCIKQNKSVRSKYYKLTSKFFSFQDGLRYYSSPTLIFFPTDAYLKDYFVVVILRAALLPTTLTLTIVTGTAKVKNADTSPYIFTTCRLIKHGDNFMFSGTADKMSHLFPL
jgi:hypothetical protein